MLSGIKNFVITFCICAIVFGVAAYYVVNFVTGEDGFGVFFGTVSPSGPVDPDNPDTTDPSHPDTDLPDTPVTDEHGNVIVPPDWEGTSFGVVLIGTDYQPELYGDYAVKADQEPAESTAETPAETAPEDTGFPDWYRSVNADSITLIYISKETAQAVFLPIPANTKVMYEGVYYPLGSLYELAGGQVVAEKVAMLTGFDVPYYAAVTMAGLTEVIDQLGGIQFHVPTDMVYEDETISYKVELKVGPQKLSGADAINMLRYKEGGEDLRRTVAIGFLQAMAKQALTDITSADLTELYSSVAEKIDTNYGMTDILDNLDLILAYGELTVVEVTYPGSLSAEDGIAYFVPDALTAINRFKQYRAVQ